MENGKNLHTVTLDADKCKGCVNCMKRCPTEAIRVREGKAKILYERCIGCGECIRVCAHHAKRAVYDSFDKLSEFKYNIALPSPSLYGQFNHLFDINYVLEGLLRVGFDKVFEVAAGAEIVSGITKEAIRQKNIEKPVISSACPAIVELILIRFHSLKKNLLPLLAPVDISAKIAKEEAAKATGLDPKDIGAFFISPCPAKIFAIKGNLGTQHAYVDGVLAQSDVYFKLVPEMNKIENPRSLARSGVVGVGWAASGGESAGVAPGDRYLAADGIENCTNILRLIEDGKLRDIDFVELNACPGGCVGGVLNVENTFVAKSRIQSLKELLPKMRREMLADVRRPEKYFWEVAPETVPVFRLDEDREVALRKMKRLEEVLAGLPLLDCGNCGAPSCRAFAEDVANGIQDEKACNRRNGEK